MTGHLDRYFRKWALYKKCLVLFIGVNVFALALALVLGINYFLFKRDLAREQKSGLEKVIQADRALELLADFSLEMKGRTRFEIKSRADEERALKILARWQEIKTALAPFGEVQSAELDAGLIFTAELQAAHERIQSQVRALRKATLEELSAGVKRHNDTTVLIILVGLLTLLFGVILPHLVLYLMGRALNQIRLEIQRAAFEFIDNWNETQARFGDDAFKNAEFWLQVLLLVGQESSRLSSHPAVQITGELAHIIRLELKKKSRESSAA